MGNPDRRRWRPYEVLSNGNNASHSGPLKTSVLRGPLSLSPGRQRFKTILSRRLRGAKIDGTCLAVVILSVIPYKRISQLAGPVVADRLLRCAAKRLATIVGTTGVVDYWGGDEFAILFCDVKEIAALGAAVKSVQERLERRMFSQEHGFYLTSNAGVAIYPTHGTDVETLMGNATAALSSSKSAGGRNRCFYSHEMNGRELRLLNLENQLLRALRKNEFTIHYQPLVDTSTWRLMAAEALLRWEHPQLGLIPPGEFVPLAEESGLITPIGEWVLRSACSQLQRWHEQGFHDLHLSVNVSARQFRELDPCNTVLRILREIAIDPSCLELELTESSIMSDDPRVLHSLSRLKAMGVRLSIDDFGTGFSSLDHLRCVPLDTIKIDKSFVRNASIRSGDAALVSSVITLAHRLNLTVVAEGVETIEQLRFLTNLGCDAVQGYFFSRPLPAELFGTFLASQSYEAAVLAG